MDDLLFNSKQLSHILFNHLKQIRHEVDQISKEQLLNNTDDQVCDFVFAKMEIVPLTLYLEQSARTEPKETSIARENMFGDRIQANAVEISISVPYTGESDLWGLQPSTFTYNPPRGSIHQASGNDQAGELLTRHVFDQNQFEANNVNNEIERNLNSIQEYLGYIKRDIDNHNKELMAGISVQVKNRRERLGVILQQSKSIKIPLQSRDGVPKPTQLIIPKRELPNLGTTKAAPEYSLANDDYNAILDVIRHEGATFERMPETFSVHGEEELRDFILAHLNGHFKGQATSETFRKKGKTDILIEAQNRAAFVAECKIWKGERTLLEAISQLLSYLTWRDVKTSLVVFNKAVAGFKSLQTKMGATLRTQANVLDVQELTEATEWRVRLRSQDDPERAVLLHVFLFNLFISQSGTPGVK